MYGMQNVVGIVKEHHQLVNVISLLLEFFFNLRLGHIRQWCTKGCNRQPRLHLDVGDIFWCCPETGHNYSSRGCSAATWI